MKTKSSTTECTATSRYGDLCSTLRDNSNDDIMPCTDVTKSKVTERSKTFYYNGHEINKTEGISFSYMRIATKWCFLTDNDYIHCTICHHHVIVGTNINNTRLPLPGELIPKHYDVCCCSTSHRLLPVEFRETSILRHYCNDRTQLSTRPITEDWKPLNQRSNSLLTRPLTLENTANGSVINCELYIVHQDLIKAIMEYVDTTHEQVVGVIRIIMEAGKEVCVQTVMDILDPQKSEENSNNNSAQGAVGGIGISELTQFFGNKSSSP